MHWTNRDGERHGDVVVDEVGAQEEDEAGSLESIVHWFKSSTMNGIIELKHYLEEGVLPHRGAGDPPEVLEVRPVLAGDEEEADPVHELQAPQRGHAHVQEHALDV